MQAGLQGVHCLWWWPYWTSLHVLLPFEQAAVHDVHSEGSDRAHPCLPGIAVLSSVRGMQGGGRAGVRHALVHGMVMTGRNDLILIFSNGLVFLGGGQTGK